MHAFMVGWCYCVGNLVFFAPLLLFISPEIGFATHRRPYPMRLTTLILLMAFSGAVIHEALATRGRRADPRRPRIYRRVAACGTAVTLLGVVVPKIPPTVSVNPALRASSVRRLRNAHPSRARVLLSGWRAKPDPAVVYALREPRRATARR